MITILVKFLLELRIGQVGLIIRPISNSHQITASIKFLLKFWIGQGDSLIKYL